MTNYSGTSGDDFFVGTFGPDTFNMQDGGNDEVSGSFGDDFFSFGGALNRYDFVGGQSGYDIPTLTGGGDDMSNSMTGIEEIDFTNTAGAQNFAIDLGAPNLSAGQTLKIDGHGLTSGDTMFASGYTGAGGVAVCNLVILGGACWNGLFGGSGNDDLDVSHSSTQISGGVTSYAYGYGGNDVIRVGNTLSWLYAVDGGTGDDTMTLSGSSYSSPTYLTKVTGIETIVLAAYYDYHLVPDELTVAAGANLTIDASALDANHWLIWYGSSETDGSFTITGGSGNDDIIGGAQRDVIRTGGGYDYIDLQWGGNDFVESGADDDNIIFGAALTAGDHADGGDGYDVVRLVGDYSAGLVFTSTTMINAELIVLGAGHSYNLTLDAATIGPMIIGDGYGYGLYVKGDSLGSGDTMRVDASAEAASTGVRLRGGQGANTLIGGAGPDQLYITASVVSTNQVFGGGGDDMIEVGAGFGPSDRIDGGTGYDRLFLSADYSAGLVFTSTTMINVEEIGLGVGHNYDLTLNAATIGPTTADGYGLYVNGNSLGSGDMLRVDASAESASTAVRLSGGQGASTLIGGAGADQLYITGSVVNTNQVSGGAGDDAIAVASGFGSSDKIDGGAGNDTLALYGSVNIVLVPATVTNVETFEFIQAGSVDNAVVVTSDATVAAGATLVVDASSLSDPASSLAFNGAAETNGSFHMLGSAGADVLTGGAGNDSVNGSSGGNDTLYGNGGKDIFAMGAAFTAADKIDGGTGRDTLSLDGDYAAGITFAATTITSVETVRLAAGHTYNLTLVDANVGNALAVNGSALSVIYSLTFNGGAETSGKFKVQGGGGNDTLTGGAGKDALTGGAGNDLIKGGLGADKLTGGAGDDHFLYGAAAESTGPSFDVVKGSDAKVDHFDLSFAVTGINATVAAGTLRSSHFDADLASVVNHAHLAKHHAVLFTPDAGNDAGKTFLIVDVNGHTGYQAGQDLVMQLTGATHLGNLDAGDFI